MPALSVVGSLGLDQAQRCCLPTVPLSLRYGSLKAATLGWIVWGWFQS